MIKVLEYIGTAFFVIVILVMVLRYFFFNEDTSYTLEPAKKTPGLRKFDYLIIATVPENKWTKHLYVRIAIDVVDEPYVYVYHAKYINNETEVYKLNEIWIEKETQEETEYSKFIGMAVDNYLKDKLLNKQNENLEQNTTQSLNINQSNNPQDNLIDKTSANPKTPSKNSFLYGADDFGEMKKGVVVDGKTYHLDNDNLDDFQILPAPKKRRKKS
jgi:hypothetical protein